MRSILLKLINIILMILNNIFHQNMFLDIMLRYPFKLTFHVSNFNVPNKFLNNVLTMAIQNSFFLSNFEIWCSFLHKKILYNNNQWVGTNSVKYCFWRDIFFHSCHYSKRVSYFTFNMIIIILHVWIRILFSIYPNQYSMWNGW